MVHIHGVKLPVIIHDYGNNLEFSSSEGSQQAAVWCGGVLIIISGSPARSVSPTAFAASAA